MLQSVIQPLVRRVTDRGGQTLIQRAIASLRARGSDAHLWLPGGDVKTYGHELVVNGGFDSDLSGWGDVGVWTAGSAAWSSGKIEVTVVTYQGAAQNISGLTVGAKYKLAAEVSAVEAGKTGRLYVGAINNPGAYAVINTSLLPVGLYSTEFIATATTHCVGLSSSSGDGVITWDNISVREITSITPTITNGLTTGNYLESTGNSIATVDNPCGLVLDALGTVGSELVTNGGFDTDITGWGDVAAWTGGSAVWSSGSIEVTVVTYQGAAQNISGLTIGASYSLNFNVAAVGSGKTGRMYVGAINNPGSTTVVNSSSLGVGSYSMIFVATATTHSIGLSSSSGDGVITWDNISVREVSGIHLTQGTTANKGLLRRGLWNLSSWSYDTSNAAWAATAATLTPNSSFTGAGLLTGLGTTTAYATVVPSNSDYGFNNGTAQTIGFRVKAATGSVVGIWSSATALGANFNLSTASVSGISCAGASMASVGDGSFIICINALKANIYERSRITLGSGYTASPTTAGVVIGQAFIFQGTLTASQILASGGIPVTTTAAASNPDAGRYSWSCDSTDLLTATFPAGYESVTVIDAKSTGQVTTAAANIVGSYSIGPSYTSYGRIVVKGSLTASELTLLQGFANRLAGL